MTNKFKLGLSALFVYVCLLLFVPFGIAGLCVDVAAGILSVPATLLMIIYFTSKRPADQSILTRLMTVHFCYVLLMFPLWYAILCAGIIKQYYPQNNSIKLLSSTVLSYSSVRIVANTDILLYFFISLSRTLFIISPAFMMSLNARLVQWISSAVMVSIFITELCLSQFVFSPEKCILNRNGLQLHSLAFPSHNRINVESVEGSEVCTLFPTFRILLTSLIICEAIRISVAIGKMWRKYKNKIRPLTHLQAPKTKVVTVRTYRKRIHSDSYITTESVHKRRRGSFPFTPFSRKSIAISINVGDTKPKAPKFLDELKSYLLLLMLREYSVVIIIAFSFLVNFLIPEFVVGQRRLLNIKIFKLELFFVPIFWVFRDIGVRKYLSICRRRVNFTQDRPQFENYKQIHLKAKAVKKTFVRLFCKGKNESKMNESFSLHYKGTNYVNTVKALSVEKDLEWLGEIGGMRRGIQGQSVSQTNVCHPQEHFQNSRQSTVIDSSRLDVEDSLIIHIQNNNLELEIFGTIPSNGDCWYHSIFSLLLYNKIDVPYADAKQLRVATVNSIHSRHPLYEVWLQMCFREKDKYLEDFKRLHCQAGVFTDNNGVIVIATAMLLNITVNIVATSNNSTTPFTVINPSETASSCFWIGYYQDTTDKPGGGQQSGHYVPLIQKLPAELGDVEEDVEDEEEEEPENSAQLLKQICVQSLPKVEV